MKGLLTSTSRGTKKIRLLLSLIPRHPQEFYDRLLSMIEGRTERFRSRPDTSSVQGWSQVMAGLEQALGGEVAAFLQESALTELEAEIRHRIDNIRAQAPFTFLHNADFVLARLCYAVCRALKPAVTVETGVAYGVTSTFILQALQINGAGVLHSIDLPPLGQDADRFVGILIPETLKERWQLHRGPSKRVLPSLLRQLGQLDLFIHDSLHTYGNMRREFQTAARFLGRPSMVIADDIESNQAFHEWVGNVRPTFSATLRQAEKPGICGMSVFR